MLLPQNLSIDVTHNAPSEENMGKIESIVGEDRNIIELEQ